MALGTKKALSSFDKLKIMRLDSSVEDGTTNDLLDTPTIIPSTSQAIDEPEEDVIETEMISLNKKIKTNASSFDKIRVINRKSNATWKSRAQAEQGDTVEPFAAEEASEWQETSESQKFTDDIASYSEKPVDGSIWQETSTESCEQTFDEAHAKLDSVILGLEGEGIAEEVKDCARALHKMMFSPVARRFLPHVSNFIYQ